MFKSFIKALLIFCLPIAIGPTMAKADIAGLTDCAQSEVFQKRLAKTVKK